jgi:S-DNA-T family DNA segregation ATPase FtsK/SpoIIIE
MLAAATIGALGASIVTGVDAPEAVVRGLLLAAEAAPVRHDRAPAAAGAGGRTPPADEAARPARVEARQPPPPPPFEAPAAPVDVARRVEPVAVSDLAARSEAATGLRVAVHLPSGERRPLASGTWTLGRASNANVRIVDRRVSRWHCELRVGDDGAVVVVDLGSKNGVVVGSERRSVHRLTSTSELLLGPVRVLVEIM